MRILNVRTLRNIAKGLVASFITLVIFSINITPAQAFAGTLENGNLAYAAGSGFDKGEACNYLPGFETGYDAWHFVLTTRGATFQQDPRNPAVAINLNFVFMRQDGSLFVIKSGAWVQTGKGAYTYTPVADRIRMVQAGTIAQINGSDSGMRLSHTCPGSGSVTPTSTPSPTPSPSVSSTPTPTTSPTSVASPTPTTSTTPTSTPSTSSSPSPSPTATPSSSASPSPSLSPSPTATPRPSSTVIPTLAPRPSARASAIQIRPTSRPNALPTPTPTPQGITETPSPSPTPTSTRSSSPSPTPTRSATPSPTPTSNPTTSPEPSSSPTPTPTIVPPVLPTPPPVEDPKQVVFVEPKTPTVIPPQSLPEPPASTIVITKTPEYGVFTITPSGQMIYTSNLSNTKSTLVDIAEITYTSSSGAVVVVRKEFLLTQNGDVPSIIQTGYEKISNSFVPFIRVIFVVTLLVLARRRLQRVEE